MSIKCPILKKAVKPSLCKGRSMGDNAVEAYAQLKVHMGSPCKHWEQKCAHKDHGPTTKKVVKKPAKKSDKKPAAKKKASPKKKE
ncbi:MAG: hypothetical protein QF415_05750 [Candidatus Undinarchaeales archaeon]|jgi:hypothetical protein|nr:hypothetical protein [Candidatus Undinarchaeales archaeon]MDP7491647.1 hypothetical protein [Candidatus Undinarchaeales archaeon]